MTFRHVAPSEVETRYVADADLCGAPGIIHGGMQAAILDEAIGFAIHAHRAFHTDEDPRADGARVVTLEFNLRFRRPAPAGEPLIVRGRVAAEEPPDFRAEAEILDETGTVLTTGQAKWRLVAGS
jgi:acyl-coenzyme A thioesterase PaaI-like protein